MEKYDGFHDHTSELDVSNKSSGVIFGSGSESREVPPSVEFTFSPTPDLIRGREIILEKERHERLLFLKDKYFHTQCWMFIQALEQQYFGDLYIGAMDDGEYSPSISEDNKRCRCAYYEAIHRTRRIAGVDENEGFSYQR